jgi:hypothetical protein
MNKKFKKVKDHGGGISSPFGCRASGRKPKLEEGFAHCIKCEKMHYVITDCEGEDFECEDCILAECKGGK